MGQAELQEVVEHREQVFQELQVHQEHREQVFQELQVLQELLG